MDEATAALDIDSEFRLLTLQRRPGGGRIVRTKTCDRDAWKRLKGAAVRVLRRPPGKAGRSRGRVVAWCGDQPQPDCMRNTKVHSRLTLTGNTYSGFKFPCRSSAVCGRRMGGTKQERFG